MSEDDLSVAQRVHELLRKYEEKVEALDHDESCKIALSAMGTLDEQLLRASARLFRLGTLGNAHQCDVITDSDEDFESLIIATYDARDRDRIRHSTRNLKEISNAWLSYIATHGSAPSRDRDICWRCKIRPHLTPDYQVPVNDPQHLPGTGMPVVFCSSRLDIPEYSKTPYMSCHGVDRLRLSIRPMDSVAWYEVMLFEAPPQFAVNWRESEPTKTIERAVRSLFRRRTLAELFVLTDGTVSQIPLQEGGQRMQVHLRNDGSSPQDTE